MREQDARPRRRAARLLGLLVLVLVGASLLAPDTVDTWADTRDAGWERATARAWADPMGNLSRRLAFDAPFRYVEDLLDGADPAVADPAVRPTPVTPSTSETPSSSEALPTGEVPSTSEGQKAPDAPPTTRAPRIADAGQPLRVLAVGDSLMLDLQHGLERVLDQRTDVRVEGRGALGFGFTVPHWDWDDDVLIDYDRLVADVAPDVVVVMIGANEFEGHAIEGEDLVPGGRQWREVLSVRADEAIAHWRAGGAHVYWWTTPRMRDARFLTDDLNAIWIEAADAWGPGVTVIESMAILGDADGSYREVLRDETGVEVPLRKDHGVHFHEVGADLLARQLEDRLVRDGWVVTRS
ncbi:MAG: DUF459 domain-containing protein [Acidimicrobiaceae bacterium]|nr:DUF459 domain-containing protein [Acidimicrobiaceae bacterium]